MASIRKNKAFAPDAQTTRFLYLILKQLDLKTINWQEVADNIGIKNGHAARMRWSRFKQHAEGTPPQPKTPKPKKTDAEKNGKRDREDHGNLTKADDDRDEKRVKFEQGGPIPNAFPPYSGYHHPQYPMPITMQHPMIKTEAPVKQEPGIDFGHTSNLSSGVPNAPPLWQSQPPPSLNVAPPQSIYALPTIDDDMDDIPIKQLKSPSHTTVSMAELQLNSPSNPNVEIRAEPSPEVPAAATYCKTEDSSVDLQKPGTSSSLPHSAALQPESLQLEPHATQPVTEDRASTPAPAVRHPDATNTPGQVSTWMTPPNPAFQSPHPQYYPTYPPGYRPHPYAQPYPSPYAHHPHHPMSFPQRPMMHSFNSWGFQPTHTPPVPQHPLVQQYPTMQSRHSNMHVSMPQSTVTSTRNSPSPQAKDQTTQHQAAQKQQIQTSSQEGKSTRLPNHEPLTTSSDIQASTNAQEDLNPEQTSSPEVTTPVQPEETSAAQPESTTASPDLVNPTSSTIPTSTTPVPALTPAQQPAASLPTTEPSPKPQLQPEPATTPRHTPLVNTAPSVATSPTPVSQTENQTPLPHHTLAPRWLHPLPPHPPTTFHHAVPSHQMPQHHSMATAYNAIPGLLPQTSVPQSNPDSPLPVADEASFDFDFDFSAIQDDLQQSLPFQVEQGQLPMEPQFLVPEEGLTKTELSSDGVHK